MEMQILTLVKDAGVGWMSCIVIINANKELQEQDRGTRGLLNGLLSAHFVLTEGNRRKGQDVKMSRQQRKSLGKTGDVSGEVRLL